MRSIFTALPLIAVLVVSAAGPAWAGTVQPTRDTDGATWDQRAEAAATAASEASQSPAGGTDGPARGPDGHPDEPEGTEELEEDSEDGLRPETLSTSHVRKSRIYLDKVAGAPRGALAGVYRPPRA